ncbi:hypothetical protein FRC02_000315 [Tulasnella sp. 418]|nr:hypothetical protein FRC02_000315 [Tulasnella sp. 418]
MSAPLDGSRVTGGSTQLGNVYTTGGSFYERERRGASSISPLSINDPLEAGLLSHPNIPSNPNPALSTSKRAIALLERLLQEVESAHILTSRPEYPHPWVVPEFGLSTTKSSCTGHYQNDSGSTKIHREQPPEYVWHHGGCIDPTGLPLRRRPDSICNTSPSHPNASLRRIIARSLTTSPIPISSSNPPTDQSLPDTSSSRLQSSLLSSLPLGRPARLEDAPGNFNLEHIKVFKTNSALLKAAKDTSPFQLERKWVKKVGKSIAAGSYGVVWQGELYDAHLSLPWSPFIHNVAIKSIGVEAEDYERLLKKLFREVLPLCFIEHPNIVRLRGYLMKGSSAWIVTDWQKHGNVVDYLKKNPNTDRLSLIVDIVNGLCHLHSRDPPIVHGDLKGDNILIGDDHSAKLIDLGLARILEEKLGAAFTTSSMARGCLHFFAPELYAGGARTMESDVWALGGLIVQIATGLLPFHGIKKNQILAELCAKRAPKLEAYGRFLYRGLLEPIIEGCWKIEPQERWTAFQIFSYLNRHFHDHNP